MDIKTGTIPGPGNNKPAGKFPGITREDPM